MDVCISVWLSACFSVNIAMFVYIIVCLTAVTNPLLVVGHRHVISRISKGNQKISYL